MTCVCPLFCCLAMCVIIVYVCLVLALSIWLYVCLWWCLRVFRLCGSHAVCETRAFHDGMLGGRLARGAKSEASGELGNANSETRAFHDGMLAGCLARTLRPRGVSVPSCFFESCSGEPRRNYGDQCDQCHEIPNRRGERRVLWGVAVVVMVVIKGGGRRGVVVMVVIKGRGEAALGRQRTEPVICSVGASAAAWS